MGAIEDFVVFEPHESSRDFKLEYPELAEDPNFNTLTTKEFRFCWLVGNRTSPLVGDAPNRRVEKAAERVFGKNPQMQEHRDLYNLKFTPKVKTAIEAMAKFNPNARMQGFLMTQYLYERMMKSISLSDEQEIAMDVDDRRKYVELLLKVNQGIPEIIKNLEHGYGIKTKKQGKETATVASIRNVTQEITKK